MFVAYERLRSRQCVSSSATGFDRKDFRSSPTGRATEAITLRDKGAKYEHPSADGTQYNEVNHAHHRNSISFQGDGLIVTASPLCSAAGQGNADIDQTVSRLPDERKFTNVVHSEEGGVKQSQQSLAEIGATQRARPAVDSPSPTVPPPPPRQPPATRLSHMAPLPLLVFDTETFLALGELDERFAFQGGIAEWLSRAKLESSNQLFCDRNPDGDPCCCDASSRAGHGPQSRDHTNVEFAGSTALLHSDRIVRHLHEREWSQRFVGAWPNEGAFSEEASRPRGSSVEKDAPRTYVDEMDELRDSRAEEGLQGQASYHPRSRVHEASPWNDDEDPKESEVVAMDHRSQLPTEELEALVQADADLFFLPLVLREPTSGEAAQDKPERECLRGTHQSLEGMPLREVHLTVKCVGCRARCCLFVKQPAQKACEIASPGGGAPFHTRGVGYRTSCPLLTSRWLIYAGTALCGVWNL